MIQQPVVSNWQRMGVLSVGRTTTTAAVHRSLTSSSHVATVPTHPTVAAATKNEITAAMIRTLYRDFIHIIKVQQKQQPSVVASKTKTQSKPQQNPLQQLREEFRRPFVVAVSNDSNATTTKTTTAAAATTITTGETIDARYQYGRNRFSFLRMNTIHYQPRTYNHTSIHGSANNSSNNNNTNTTNGTERYMYKNGQRYPLHADEGTLRHHPRGYVVSPYDGKNLDPQSVTRHRQNLKRMGFINNAHAKGMF